MFRAVRLGANSISGPPAFRWFHFAFFLPFFFATGCSVPPSKVRLPSSDTRPSQVGIASWYGPGFHGKATASGIIYDQNEFTAAHQTLPIGTRVLVTNMENGSTTEVTINDRGPFAKDRIIDLSRAAAETIGMIGPGTALVRIDVVDNPARIRSIRNSLDYTLQLGSFSQFENARQLRDRLADSFGEITISPVNNKDTTYYRVYLGSFSSRADAEQRARQISQAGYSVIIMEK
jgi:rare lipoprotein A